MDWLVVLLINNLKQLIQIAEQQFDQLRRRNPLQHHWPIEHFVQDFQVANMRPFGVKKF